MELRRQDEALPAPMGIRAEVASNPGVETPDGPKTHAKCAALACPSGVSVSNLGRDPPLYMGVWSSLEHSRCPRPLDDLKVIVRSLSHLKPIRATRASTRAGRSARSPTASVPPGGSADVPDCLLRTLRSLLLVSLSHRDPPRDYDEPQTLPHAISSICPVGPDGEQGPWRRIANRTSSAMLRVLVFSMTQDR